MFRKISMTIVLVLVLAVTSVMPAFAQDVQPVDPINPVPTVETDGIIDETAGLWFVELNSDPTIEGTSLSVTKAEKKAFRDAARRAGLKYSERRAFDTLWNGLSIKIDASQLSALTRLPGVKAVYPIETIAMPIPFEEANNPELFTALAQTGGGYDLTWNTLDGGGGNERQGGGHGHEKAQRAIDTAAKPGGRFFLKKSLGWNHDGRQRHAETYGN